ncbi:hypothetical protein DFP72DRAFT_1110700 [Ephemerocybe angulata]|uniref:Uncharacterized protein n=1 Tax=Ephemerocybe angulata TaxID=980116 RepID=A0A8H6I2Y2_9AGAR|nr:hypothetical protein DFP72DRAFT_1110700 [Tulosesus angulatus]
MEREFLHGVDFNLYVDKPTYESWLHLLKGLVQAKEHDSLSSLSSGHNHVGSSGVGRRGDARRRGERGERRGGTVIPPLPPSTYQAPATTTPTRLPPLIQPRAGPSAYYYPHTTTASSSNQAQAQQYATAYPQSEVRFNGGSAFGGGYAGGYARARSSSPTPTSTGGVYGDVRMEEVYHPSHTATQHPSTHQHSTPPHQYGQGGQQQHSTPPPQQQYGHGAQGGVGQQPPTSANKRTAEAMFSPMSASFGAHLPSKRPLSMVLSIPDSLPSSATTQSQSQDPRLASNDAEALHLVRARPPFHPTTPHNTLHRNISPGTVSTASNEAGDSISRTTTLRPTTIPHHPLSLASNDARDSLSRSTTGRFLAGFQLTPELHLLVHFVPEPLASTTPRLPTSPQSMTAHHRNTSLRDLQLQV